MPKASLGDNLRLVGAKLSVKDANVTAGAKAGVYAGRFNASTSYKIGPIKVKVSGEIIGYGAGAHAEVHAGKNGVGVKAGAALNGGGGGVGISVTW